MYADEVDDSAAKKKKIITFVVIGIAALIILLLVIGVVLFIINSIMKDNAGDPDYLKVKLGDETKFEGFDF